MISPNSIIQGDCLEWLDSVKPNSVDLCYIDPPFFTQRNFPMTLLINGMCEILIWVGCEGAFKKYIGF